MTSFKKRTTAATKSFEEFVSTKYSGRYGVGVNATSDDRAYHMGGSIYIRDTDVKRVVFHESGHAIELVGSNHKAAIAFRNSRTSGDKTKLLSEVCPGYGYDNSERTREDNFYSPYVGKIYTNASEVISMGVEMFATPSKMKQLYNKDKEHFALTLAVMAGDFI